jgi:hypothetical protein
MEDKMWRFLLLIFVFILAVGIPVICGFAFIEALIIFCLAIFWLGFLGWAMRKCNSGMIRCVFFWFFSIILDKPELLYPKK